MNNEESTIFNDNRNKVVFLGDSNVGKTSVVEQIMYGSFNGLQQPTVYLECAKKIVTHKGQTWRLSLWDTAGQQKFNSMIPSFVRGCDCAVVVFDVTNKESLKNCENWIKMARNGSNQHEPAVILLANKTDLDRSVTTGQAFEIAIKNKISYMETSAKNGKGIENLVSQIVQNIEKSKFKSQKQTKSSQGELNTSRKLTAKKVPVSKPSQGLKVKKGNMCCSI